ncbi:HalX domain-containing protein [Halorussus amylolyticus]|uniref:HalX domain-containing protein n=1 Tax=Halorussus amylolyticus TaxID=1126242 RepID=UPI00104B403A|nr:response regulator [Halorussus amylolyticus]
MSTVLVVEDEAELAETYACWLRDSYDVRIALSGSEALDELEANIDAVLLDRRMPEMTGDEVLDEIRSRGYDVRVAMLTALEPDYDIFEMGFDEYAVKPVLKDDIRQIVEALLRRSQYTDRLLDYFTLVSKRVALETHKPAAELERNDEYRRLETRETKLEREMESALAEFSSEDFEALFYDIGGERANSTS